MVLRFGGSVSLSVGCSVGLSVHLLEGTGVELSIVLSVCLLVGLSVGFVGGGTGPVILHNKVSLNNYHQCNDCFTCLLY